MLLLRFLRALIHRWRSAVLSRPPLLLSLSLSLSLLTENGKQKQPCTNQKQPFTAPSALFWCLLSLATVVDYKRTKQLSAVTRGASVRRGIRWVVFLYALDSILLLTLSLASNDTSKFSDVVDFVSLLLEDFAEAAFLLLLLAVAAGAGIARPGLGPHRSKVLLVPAVYLVTTLVVDLAEVKNLREERARKSFPLLCSPFRRRRQEEKEKEKKLNLEIKQKQEYVSLKDGWLADLEGGAAGVLQGSAATLFNACQVRL